MTGTRIAYIVIGGWLLFIVVLGHGPLVWPQYEEEIKFGCGIFAVVLTLLLLIKSRIESNERTVHRNDS